MIPYGRQDISQVDIDAVLEVLRSDWLTQGPMVPRFEEAVANYVGAQHAVAVNSATGALHIACLALGVGPGDWVWTSPNTFVASANCALYCGAKVDFVDIDPRTYNMSPERLAEKLERARAENRLPKAVIPVHFAGQPCDMLAIRKLSQEYGFKIIEDASHAIGASYSTFIASGETSSVTESHDNQTFIARREAAWRSSDQVMVGSCTHSHVTVFSFHPVKIITTGEGGMALTNDPDLAEKLSRLRAHGITSKPEFMQSRVPEEIWNYQQTDLGFNYRMSDIQAAMGLSQLVRLDEFVSNRREIAVKYDRAFTNLSITTPWQDPRMQSSYHLYPILIEHGRCGRGQREVYQAMRQAGVLVNLHYIPVHRQPYYERMGFEQGYCPNAEHYHRTEISLPMYSSLTSDQQYKVVTTLRDVLSS
jgi:dTDP-4-amino-4,6-dideoxygalactose transaminase